VSASDVATPLVSAKGLQVGTADPLFEALELDIRPGDVVLINGENGAGKSSLLRTLAGEQPPLGGELRVAPGVRFLHLPQHAGRALPGPFSVADMLRLAGLETTSHPWIPADKGQRFDCLSAGQRQRLVLAMAQLTPCSVLLLDEPTQFLDANTRSMFQVWVDAPWESCRAQALVIVSHDDVPPPRGAHCIELRRVNA